MESGHSMNSHFELELDTTGPEINIISPSYTTNAINDEVLVVANEPLADYQDIYMIDSQGAKHELTFEYDTNQYKGLVDFRNVSIGIATIYARVKDEVLNDSNTATASIDVRQTVQVFITTEESLREIPSFDEKRSIEIDDSIREINTAENIRDILLNNEIRGIELYISE